MVYYKKKNTFRKISIITFTVILVLGGGIYFWVKSLLPNYSGVKKINTSQTNIYPKQKVEIYRDSFGKPHIYAQDEFDLYFALGYAMAQDRLFQMDIIRRAVSGKLSEILGEDLISVDKLFLTIKAGKNFEEDIEKLPKGLVNQNEAFALGVNTFIQTEKLPIEFKILRYKPELWQKTDGFNLLYYMAWSLNASYHLELFCNIMQDKLGEKKAEALCPRNPELIQNEYPTSQETNPINLSKNELKKNNKLTNYQNKNTTHALNINTQIINTQNINTQNINTQNINNQNINTQNNITKNTILENFLATDYKARKLLQVAPRGGSNNWVISSNKSSTGHPLLASDMHLQVSQPGIWYAAHLVSPEININGLLLPGTPLVVVGSNTNIAWAFTNIGPDDCDFFEETLDDKDPSLYKVGNKFEKIKTIEYLIKVKNKNSVKYTLAITRHGPIINDIYYKDKKADDKKPDPKNLLTKPIAMQWTLHKYQEESYALYYLNKAKTLSDIENAAKYFRTPGQNWVYADNKDNIGYTPAVCIPKRNYDGFKIQDGAKDNGKFGECINLKKLVLKNPKKGWIATANQRLSNEKSIIENQYFETAFRSIRIQELLNQKDRLDLNDFQNMQNDTKNIFFNEWKTVLKNLQNENLSELEKKALNLLTNWDGNSNSKSIEASIFYTLFVKSYNNLFSKYLSTLELEIYDRDWIMPYRAFNFALQNENNELFSKNENDQINSKSNIKDFTQKKWILQSYKDSIKYLSDNFGSNINKWEWGKLHKLNYTHIFGIESKLMGYFFNRGPFNVGGGIFTINPMSFSLREPFDVNNFASERLIFDLSNPDLSLETLPSGISGNFQSPHYDDQISDYLNGKYHQIYFSKDKVIENSKYHLVLEPN